MLQGRKYELFGANGRKTGRNGRENVGLPLTLDYLLIHSLDYHHAICGHSDFFRAVWNGTRGGFAAGPTDPNLCRNFRVAHNLDCAVL